MRFLKSRKTVRDNAVVELRLLFMSINLIRHSFSGVIQVPRCLSGCGSVIKSGLKIALGFFASGILNILEVFDKLLSHELALFLALNLNSLRRVVKSREAIAVNHQT